MDLSVFHNQFRDETGENVRLLSATLLELEQSPPEARRANLDAAFRAVHTIKGSARMLGFEDVGRLAHAMENILGSLRQQEYELDRPLADLLLRGGDAILALTAVAVDGGKVDIDLDALVAAFSPSPPALAQTNSAANLPAEEAAPALPPAPAPTAQLPADPAQNVPAPSAPAGRAAANRQTVRVRVDRLDRLLNLAGELVIGQQGLAGHAEQLHALDGLVEGQTRALAALAAELQRLRFSASQREALDRHIASLRDHADLLRDLIHRESDQLGRYLNQQWSQMKDLEAEVMSARLMPIATVLSGLPRAVRDLAQATNKQVVLELRGETTELDRKVLEALNEPLVHLVRNAIDHGIELPAERVAAGKDPVGRITVAAEALGGEVRITISDDGRGIDETKLRAAAVHRGLISAEQADLLSPAEALDLVFLPGLSTARMITDISGRGVGMDVVRTNISELGGHVVAESELGVGTRILLLLPLTLVTTRVLLVRVGRQRFALAASGCQGTTWLYRDHINPLEAQATALIQGRTVVVQRLADLLGIAGEPSFARSERAPIILLGNAQRHIALLVDDLLDEREAVVKPLGPLFEDQRVYSGAVQLGDGDLVLLLNPVQLNKHSRNRNAAGMLVDAVQVAPSARLLVVDDSFTTRELIKSILQSAGYTVTAAIDGADALDKLRAGSYDLVVSDVEMPRVDGFQLTSRIRRELGRGDLPVILVTSLASESHRRQGLEAGAQAYIVKSQFNQDNLLDAIQQLLGVE